MLPPSLALLVVGEASGASVKLAPAAKSTTSGFGRPTDLRRHPAAGLLRLGAAPLA